MGYAESRGFVDAVGDIAGALLGPYVSSAAAQADYVARQQAKQQVPSPYTIEQRADGFYVYNTKWGASIGWFQIRSLREPQLWGKVDALRVASDLRQALANAKAAFAISEGGKKWDLWSTFRDGTYEQFLDLDYSLKTGHARAADWDV